MKTVAPSADTLKKVQLIKEAVEGGKGTSRIARLNPVMANKLAEVKATLDNNDVAVCLLRVDENKFYALSVTNPNGISTTDYFEVVDGEAIDLVRYNPAQPPNFVWDTQSVQPHSFE